MNEKTTELSKVIAEIKQVRRSYVELLEKKPDWGEVPPPPAQIVERFFLSEIAEIITLLTLIENSSKRYFDRKALIQKERAKRFQHGIFRDLRTEFSLLNLPEEHLWPEQEIPLFIKALHEWIFHIYELFRKNPDTIGMKFPTSGPLKQQLVALCDFRATLITHKNSELGDVSGGHMMETDSGEVELWVQRMNLGEDEKVLDKLYTACSQELNLESLEYDHRFSRLRILAEHRHELTGSTRDELEKFIARNGFISQTSTQIARFIKEMLNTMISNS